MKIEAPPVISSSYHLPINKTKVLFQRIKLSSNSLFSIRNPETMKLQISLRLLSLNSRIFISSGGEQRCFWCERCPPVGSWAGNECYLVLNQFVPLSHQCKCVSPNYDLSNKSMYLEPNYRKTTRKQKGGDSSLVYCAGHGQLFHATIIKLPISLVAPSNPTQSGTMTFSFLF